MDGHGLHTGSDCRIVLHPSKPDTGLTFVTPHGEIRADIQCVHDTNRGTTLKSGDAEIHTVEHLLAALSGMEIDNARIEVNGPEIPAADGSALPFVELINQAGIVEQSADAVVRRLAVPVWVDDASKHILAMPAERFHAAAFISFPHPLIGEQALGFTMDPATFAREIAPARTFCTSAEIEAILSQGLGRGGTAENVVIAHEDHYSVPLRFPDEFVRHKLLDLIGDLALAGGRLYADITGIRTSHTLNIALASKIAGSVYA